MKMKLISCLWCYPFNFEVEGGCEDEAVEDTHSFLYQTFVCSHLLDN